MTNTNNKYILIIFEFFTCFVWQAKIAFLKQKFRKLETRLQWNGQYPEIINVPWELFLCEYIFEEKKETTIFITVY